MMALTCEPREAHQNWAFWRLVGWRCRMRSCSAMGMLSPVVISLGTAMKSATNEPFSMAADGHSTGGSEGGTAWQVLSLTPVSESGGLLLPYPGWFVSCRRGRP